MTLSLDQKKLHDLMSDTSEAHWFARWLIGTEYRLWAFMVDPSDDGDWGRGILPQELRAELATLSQAVGGWICWDDGEDGRPSDPLGVRFVPLAAWSGMYEAWRRGQEAALEMPRGFAGYPEWHRIKQERTPTDGSKFRLPTAADIASTASLIAPHVRRTPVVEIPAADFGLSGLPIGVKLEFMQHSGTFKARGAFANLLTRDGAKAGVVAASGGNHGAAVAYAAQQLGTPAHIFVPSISSPAKVARIRQYGADVVVGGERYNDALEASRTFAAQHGLLEIHAYDRFETLCGQGTTGREWLEQAPELDTILIAVGGGGLIGGIAAAVGGRVKIVGVEPENAPTLHDAIAAGEPVDVPVSGIAADSLGARRIGEHCFAQRAHIDRSVLVTDDAITEAQRLIWDVLRVVVEPGGAAAMAALIARAYVPAPDERVGVLLCGANTTAVTFD